MNAGLLELTLDLLMKTILDFFRLLVSRRLKLRGKRSMIKLVICKFLNNLFFGILDGNWRASGPDSSSISHLVLVVVGLFMDTSSFCLFVRDPLCKIQHNLEWMK